jgi:hypothetical protein
MIFAEAEAEVNIIYLGTIDPLIIPKYICSIYCTSVYDKHGDYKFYEIFEILIFFLIFKKFKILYIF